MAARIKNNRPGIQRFYVYCSSGPNHKGLDLNIYGGLLICKLWSQYLKDDLLK